MLEKLAAGELDVSVTGEDVQLQVERPTIFVLYEQNIGMLTPMIAEELRDAERTTRRSGSRTPSGKRCELNKRSWRYVLRILERWRAEGKDSGRERGKAKQGLDAYDVPEGYEGLIKH